jgi:hypothetical protein
MNENKQRPTIGRIVHYKVNAAQAGHAARAGEVLPAIIVAVGEGDLVSLQVFLNGSGTLYMTDRAEAQGEGHGAGTWAWPPRG